MSVESDYIVYAHLDERTVKAGDTVRAGDPVGTVGMTGSAYSYPLHFEVRVSGAPSDPRKFLELPVH